MGDRSVLQRTKLLAGVVVLGSVLATDASAAPSQPSGSRDAWLVCADEARPALLLGPSSAFVPLPSESSRPTIADGPRMLLCAELGCAVVESHDSSRQGSWLGIEVATVAPVGRVDEVDPAEIPGLLQAGERYEALDEREVHPPPEPGRDSFMEQEHERAPRARRSRAARREPGTLTWSDPGPWTGEVGLMGGAGSTLEGRARAVGLASARVGFRFLRRRGGGSASLAGGIAGGIVDGVITALVGNHLGADLQADVTLGADGLPAWSVTVHPSLAVALPERPSSVGVRFPSLLGIFAIGVGGRGSDVGLALQLDPRVSLLVTRRFGLDLRCSLTASASAGSSFACGLGGFVR